MSEIPEGWAWAKLEDIVLNPKQDIVDGPFGSNLKASEYVGSGVPIIRLQNVQRNRFLEKNLRFITPEKADDLSRHSFQKGDIVITKLGDPVGEACIVPDSLEHGIIVADVVRARLNEKFTSKLFTIFAINSPAVISQLSLEVKGSTRPRVNLGQIRSLKIPIAPLNEQRRVVEKLDKLLSRVDAARARLATIPRILKRFRQSVLAAACSGRLTADWRKQGDNCSNTHVNLEQLEEERKSLLSKLAEQKGAKKFTYKPSVKIDIGNKTKGIEELFELPPYWQWVSLGQATYDISDGPHFSPKYVDKDSGVPFISGRNISYSGIDFSDAKYVSKNDHAEFIKRAKPMRRDVLLTKGGTTGIATVVDTDEEFSIWVHVALLKVIERFVSPYYLRDALSSSFVYKQSQEQTHGVGNQDLGLTRMIYMALPLPPYDEQQEIVRRVEALFKTADALEARYRTAQAHVDKLTQSILARAFRGELVTTEAELARQEGRDYEPASVLLERIRQERAQQGSASKQKPKRAGKQKKKQDTETKAMFN